MIGINHLKLVLNISTNFEPGMETMEDLLANAKSELTEIMFKLQNNIAIDETAELNEALLEGTMWTLEGEY